ncbi:MAG: bL32 family ribosomal protein [Dehalococcoidia bacterium]|nr:MAG: ribosomal protein L32 [Chloroflexota bacterium]
MTALPKKKHTRARRGNKRSHKGLSVPNGHRYNQMKRELLGLNGDNVKAEEAVEESTQS